MYYNKCSVIHIFLHVYYVNGFLPAMKLNCHSSWVYMSNKGKLQSRCVNPLYIFVLDNSYSLVFGTKPRYILGRYYYFIIYTNQFLQQTVFVFTLYPFLKFNYLPLNGIYFKIFSRYTFLHIHVPNHSNNLSVRFTNCRWKVVLHLKTPCCAKFKQRLVIIKV